MCNTIAMLVYRIAAKMQAAGQSPPTSLADLHSADFDTVYLHDNIKCLLYL